MLTRRTKRKTSTAALWIIAAPIILFGAWFWWIDFGR